MTPWISRAVAWLCLAASIHAQGGLRPDTQSQRQAIEYSKRSTIVPDPDANPVDEEKAKEWSAKFGHWHFWDGEEADRPEDKDMCKDVPNCDVVGDDFADDAWQSDAVYVNHILNDADELVGRAMEAIFEEYGHPKPKTAAFHA